ncbi:glycosyltransferase family 2 protein [Geotalea uraniireducens]|uniref:Glycosyl transferase, family 2 n=1 Tax=Geotalea uraniireducens (strain Rf4) TaxID=351605 RepID=A5G406_GEOUR|nr:glycosyltransferase family A protein [Geotalea uraniireducens]ABQ26524.1 glycosyl transferase, family 2 [Geotalea uraniireducens Rf4]
MVSVSAVIPTYNGTRYLVDAVQSALTQTYELLEIIVVDDGSEADIEKILAPFFPKVKYVRQENAGPAAARNHGISIAKGDLIALLDDDDMWHPTKTAVQVQRMIENPECGLVYSYQELIDEQGRVIPNEAPTEFPSGSVYREFLTKNRIGTPSATLIRREVFEKIGLFDETRECISCEDYDLWLRISGNFDVMFCPGTLVSYRVRNSGISQNLDKHLKAHHYVFNKLISQHIESPKLTDREFYAAFGFNLHHTLKRFAYGYYYIVENRTKARCLMLAVLRKHPFCLKDILYFIIFSMPDPLFRVLRKTKQELADACLSLQLKS